MTANVASEQTAAHLLVKEALSNEKGAPTLSQGWHAAWAQRRVSLFWVEKLWLVVQYGQLYALMWAFARAWPLPFVLRSNTRWTVWLNVDVPSFFTYREDEDVVPTMRGSIFGVLPGYSVIAIIWALVPIAVIAVVAFVLWYARHRYFRIRGATQWLLDVAVNVGLVLQLPTSLLLLRAYICEAHPLYEGLRLSVEPEVACLSGPHFAVMVVCAPTCAFALLGFPLWLLYRARACLVYGRRYQHERYLRWLEAEYVHGLSDSWRADRVWLVSSFRRGAGHPYDRGLWALSMSALVAVFVFLRSLPAIQTDILFAVTALWSLRQLALPGYRCATSNVLASTVYSGLSVIMFWGVMRAHQIKSSLTVDSAWAQAVNVMSGVLCALVVLLITASALPAFGWPRGFIGSSIWRLALQEDGKDRSSGRQRPQQQPLGGMPALRASASAEMGPPDWPQSQQEQHWVLRLLTRSRLLMDRQVATLPASVGMTDLRSARSTRLVSHAVRSLTARSARHSGGFASPLRDAASPAPGSDKSGRRGSLESHGSLAQRWASPAKVHPEPLLQPAALVAGGGVAAGTTPSVPAPAARPPLEAARHPSDERASGRAPSSPQRRAIPPLRIGGVGAPGSSAEAGGFTHEATVIDVRGGGGGGGARHADSGDEVEDNDDDDLDALLEARERAFEAQQRREATAAVTEAAAATSQDGAGFAPAGVRPGTGLRDRRPLVNGGTPLDLEAGDGGGGGEIVDAGKAAAAAAIVHAPLTVAEVSALEAVWVALIRAARSCLRLQSRRPPELVHVPLLRSHARTLRRELRRALRCRHVLAWSLEEAIDDCSTLADRAAAVTVFPNPEFEALLAHLRARCRQRDYDYSLSHPRRKTLMLKLTALVAFMGGRRVARLRIRGVNDLFFVDPALLAAALQRAQATGKPVDMVRLADECERLLGAGRQGPAGGPERAPAPGSGLPGVMEVAGAAAAPGAAGGSYATSLGLAVAAAAAQLAAAGVGGSTAPGPAAGSAAATASAALAGKAAATRLVAGAADEEEREERELSEALHAIPSDYRDVGGEEVSMLGAAALREIVRLVLPERLRAEVKRWMARNRRVAAAAAAGGAVGLGPASRTAEAERYVARSGAILLALEREPPDVGGLPSDAAISADTAEMLTATYDRCVELAAAVVGAPSTPAITSDSAEVARLRGRVGNWLLQLLPATAAERGVLPFDDRPDAAPAAGVAGSSPEAPWSWTATTVAGRPSGVHAAAAAARWNSRMRLGVPAVGGAASGSSYALLGTGPGTPRSPAATSPVSPSGTQPSAGNPAVAVGLQARPGSAPRAGSGASGRFSAPLAAVAERTDSAASDGSV
jgi:hypothetical protein